jgi:hypothetical protein
MRRARFLGLVVAGALVPAGCGSDDHPNEDRPPAPIELTAKVTKKKVTISPPEVGAGLANITLANLSSDPVTLTLEGPDSLSGSTIAPHNVGTLKFDLSEGPYSVGAGADSSAAPTRLEVGPERPTSQNELLLP